MGRRIIRKKPRRIGWNRYAAKRSGNKFRLHKKRGYDRVRRFALSPHNKSSYMLLKGGHLVINKEGGNSLMRQAARVFHLPQIKIGTLADSVMSASDNDLQLLYPDAELIRIGEGGFGEVYLASYPDGRQVVIKRYKDVETLSDMMGSLPPAIPFDMDAKEKEHTSEQMFMDLAVIQDIYNLQSELLPKGTRMVNAKKGLRNDIMELEYVDGIDLHQIITNPDVPQGLKDILKNRYRDLVDTFLRNLEFHNDFEVNDRVVSMEHKGAFFEDPIVVWAVFGDWESHTKIMIKPDNVLFERNTGDLVIIDPF